MTPAHRQNYTPFGIYFEWVTAQRKCMAGNEHPVNEKDNDNTIFKWSLIYFALHFLFFLALALVPFFAFSPLFALHVIKLMSTPQNVYVFILLATKADKKGRLKNFAFSWLKVFFSAHETSLHEWERKSGVRK